MIQRFGLCPPSKVGVGKEFETTLWIWGLAFVSIESYGILCRPGEFQILLFPSPASKLAIDVDAHSLDQYPPLEIWMQGRYKKQQTKLNGGFEYCESTFSQVE